jgi:hypothetical protein
MARHRDHRRKAAKRLPPSRRRRSRRLAHTPPRSFAVRLACYTWAAPTTLVGLIAGVLILGTGGRVQARRGALEFHSGLARWFMDRIGFDAMTLGHAILGRNAALLDLLRDHEQVHVRQAERWGPAFLPAYLAASIVAWRRGGHYYRDNWFERDARRGCGEPD